MTTGADQSERTVVPARPSRRARVFRALAWFALVCIVVVTLGPVSWRPDFGHVNVERFIGFGVLSFLFVMGYPRRQLLAVSILCAAALGLELLQVVVPGRDASLFNALIKLGGCAIGAATASALNWLINHLRPGPTR